MGKDTSAKLISIFDRLPLEHQEIVMKITKSLDYKNYLESRGVVSIFDSKLNKNKK